MIHSSCSFKNDNTPGLQCTVSKGKIYQISINVTFFYNSCISTEAFWDAGIFYLAKEHSMTRKVKKVHAQFFTIQMFQHFSADFQANLSYDQLKSIVKFVKHNACNALFYHECILFSTSCWIQQNQYRYIALRTL